MLPKIYIFQNPRKYKDVVVVTNQKQLEKYLNSDRVKKATIISDNLTILDLKKNKVKLCRPLYAGFTILDYAKLHMARFHYSVIKPLMGDSGVEVRERSGNI